MRQRPIRGVISRVSGRLGDHVYREVGGGRLTVARRKSHLGPERNHPHMLAAQAVYNQTDRLWHKVPDSYQIEWGRCTPRVHGGRLSAYHAFKQLNSRRLLAGFGAVCCPPSRFGAKWVRYRLNSAAGTSDWRRVLHSAPTKDPNRPPITPGPDPPEGEPPEDWIPPEPPSEPDPPQPPYDFHLYDLQVAYELCTHFHADFVLRGIYDPQGLELSLAIADGPDHGTLTVPRPDIFRYTPDDGFYGTDSITWTVTNTNGDYLIVTTLIDVLDPLPFPTGCQNPVLLDVHYRNDPASWLPRYEEIPCLSSGGPSWSGTSGTDWSTEVKLSWHGPEHPLGQHWFLEWSHYHSTDEHTVDAAATWLSPVGTGGDCLPSFHDPNTYHCTVDGMPNFCAGEVWSISWNVLPSDCLNSLDDPLP